MNNSNNNTLSFKQILPLLLVIFIDSLTYFLVIPVFLRLFLHSEYGLIPLQATIATRNLFYGISIALSPLAFLISAPIVGRLSDQFGRKCIIFICLVASALGFFIPILGIQQHNIFLVMLGRFLAGIGTSSQPIAQAAIADRTSGRQKAIYLGFIGFAMTLALMLGPIFGGLLSDPKLFSGFNVTTPYWCAGILTLINLILLVSLFKEKLHIKKTNHSDTKKSLKILFHVSFKSNISQLLLIFLFLELAWSQYYQSIFLFMSEYFHATTRQISIFTVYIGIFMCLGLTLIYRSAVKNFRLPAIIKSSLAIISLGLLLCTVIPNLWSQWVFVILVAVFVGLAYPSLLAEISNHVDKNHQGWIMGITSTLLAFAWMVTALITGPLLTFNPHLPLAVATIFMFLSLIPKLSKSVCTNNLSADNNE